MSELARFSGIVLAAGTSSRMPGAHKLLLPIGGEPIIRRTVCCVLEANPQELVVVTGYQEPGIREALAGLPVRFEANPAFEQGQMGSVAVGARALRLVADAVMVCLGDMALLAGEDYRELVRAFSGLSGRSILVPHFAGRRGNPVLLAWRHLPQLIRGYPKLGCRKLIDEHPQEVFAYAAAHDRFVFDVDTPEDYSRLVRRLGPVPRFAQDAVA